MENSFPLCGGIGPRGLVFRDWIAHESVCTGLSHPVVGRRHKRVLVVLEKRICADDYCLDVGWHSVECTGLSSGVPKSDGVIKPLLIYSRAYFRALRWPIMRFRGRAGRVRVVKQADVLCRNPLAAPCMRGRQMSPALRVVGIGFQADGSLEEAQWT